MGKNKNGNNGNNNNGVAVGNSNGVANTADVKAPVVNVQVPQQGQGVNPRVIAGVVRKPIGKKVSKLLDVNNIGQMILLVKYQEIGEYIANQITKGLNIEGGFEVYPVELQLRDLSELAQLQAGNNPEVVERMINSVSVNQSMKIVPAISIEKAAVGLGDTEPVVQTMARQLSMSKKDGVDYKDISQKLSTLFNKGAGVVASVEGDIITMYTDTLKVVLNTILQWPMFEGYTTHDEIIKNFSIGVGLINDDSGYTITLVNKMYA